MSAIDCIVTAAGLSLRMGQWRMMLPWQQGAILDTSIKNALQFCSRIILITDYRGGKLHERYANQSNTTIIRNPDYAQGLLISVRTAVPAVQTEHCFLTHGDMPALTIDIFKKVWSLRNDGVILPLHNGIPGHPILVSKPYLMQTIQRSNIAGIRQALLIGEHYSVEIGNAEIILDINTPDNFTTAKKRHTEVQETQLNDRVQISSPSSTLYHNDKELLILRRGKK